MLPLTTAQWRRVLGRLAGQALFRAKLLAGEMPREIEEVFAECGTPLFPGSAADLDMHCSCPDWGVPCKHLAAVCYVLAPGGEAQFLQACQELGPRRFDPGRPLWELWLLPGLPERRLGALLRLHHVIADGPAALAAFGTLLDVDANASTPAPAPWVSERDSDRP